MSTFGHRVHGEVSDVTLLSLQLLAVAQVGRMPSWLSVSQPALHSSLLNNTGGICPKSVMVF